MARIKVCTYNEISEGELKKFTADQNEVVLYKLNGDIFATTNVCTHEACILDENSEVRGDVVECTCHGSQFDIRTGQVLLPPAIEPLKTYKTEVLGDDVYVEV